MKSGSGVAGVAAGAFGVVMALGLLVGLFWLGARVLDRIIETPEEACAKAESRLEAARAEFERVAAERDAAWTRFNELRRRAEFSAMFERELFGELSGLGLLLGGPEAREAEAKKQAELAESGLHAGVKTGEAVAARESLEAAQRIVQDVCRP